MEGSTKKNVDGTTSGSDLALSGAAVEGEWAGRFAKLMTGDAGPGYSVNREENWVKLRVDKPHSGHDSTPAVFVLHRLSTALAIADGMGGRGAQHLAGTCHAALASRLALDMINDLVGRLVGLGPGPEMARIIERRLHEKLKSAWNGALCEGLGEVSPFGGTMMSNLPTTFTMAEVVRPPAVPGLPFAVNTFNCGDSRVYVLETAARGGLAALTNDDTRVPVDAFTALVDDPPLARFLTADRIQPVTFGCHILHSPCLVIACSDGFHHYFRTPMGVELLLRKAMAEAMAEPDILGAFARTLESHFEANLHDDVTAAIMVVGGPAASVFADLTLPAAEQERARQLMAEERVAADAPKTARANWERRRKADFERYKEVGS
ncbi:MAG: hypothetical protein HYU59_04875 [Magnetospirillum gryphiswaldense]|nr:hypothetical protein [Magnetospirillum gryphiswaldense]